MTRVVVGRVLTALVLAAAIGVALVAAGRIEIPRRFDPFAPLVVDDEVNWLTRMKLARTARDGALCVRALQGASRLSASPIADQKTGEACGYEDAVRIERAAPGFSPAGPAMTCRLALGWAMFERHALDAAAREIMGSQIARVEHLGVYACRNIYHKAQARRSEHAGANDIDIAAFVLADGRRVDVKRDWEGEGAAARFLRSARDGACRYFNVVLGPDYNEAHRDHFHLDMGGYRACR
ncbi:MAG TPA: extensin family protein [Beijerinckiaceae bacterium]|jgi:hypothetical protein